METNAPSARKLEGVPGVKNLIAVASGKGRLISLLACKRAG
jgi:hypothetical protein